MKRKQNQHHLDMIWLRKMPIFILKIKFGGIYRIGIKKPFYSGNIWRFIFDRELIIKNRIKFNINMTYAEDEIFIYHVCRYLDFKKHLYFDDIVYHYRIRPTSLTHKSKYNKLQEHCKSMLILSEEYKRCLNEKNYPKLLERTTYDRYRVAVATVLWDNAMLQEKSSPKIILELKKRELYPYSFCMKLLKIKDLKTMLVNYNKFLFNILSYYKAFCFLRKLVKK